MWEVVFVSIHHAISARRLSCVTWKILVYSNLPSVDTFVCIFSCTAIYLSLTRINYNLSRLNDMICFMVKVSCIHCFRILACMIHTHTHTHTHAHMHARARALSLSLSLSLSQTQTRIVCACIRARASKGLGFWFLGLGFRVSVHIVCACIRA